LIEIAQRLGKDENYIKSINIGLDQLFSMNVTFSDFLTGVMEFRKVKFDTALILRRENSQKGRHGINNGNKLKGWVDIDWRIVKMFVGGIFGKINQADYIKLGTGAPRKLIQILASQQTIFGEEFVIDMEELSSLLCLTWPGRTSSLIKRYMKDINNVMPQIEWEIKKYKGRTRLWVKWKNVSEITLEDVNPYAAALFEIYGKNNLESIGIFEDYQVTSILNKLYQGEEVKVGRKKVPKEEVVLDIFLLQQFKYGVKPPKHGLDSYLKKMYSSLEIPTEYRFCLDIISEKKKKEAAERMEVLAVEKKKVEEEARIERYNMVKKIIDGLRDSSKEKDRKSYQNLEEVAKLKLEGEGGIISPLFIQDEMIQIATEFVFSENYNGEFNFNLN
jgi:hypothetical protein